MEHENPEVLRNVQDTTNDSIDNNTDFFEEERYYEEYDGVEDIDGRGSQKFARTSSDRFSPPKFAVHGDSLQSPVSSKI